MKANNERWYHRAGPDGALVISTRIRLARNLPGIPFPNRMSDAQKKEVCTKVRDALNAEKAALPFPFHYVEMESLPGVTAQALAERHLISPGFAAQPAGRALLLSEDESVSIMLCEEDHVRIQVMAAGLSLKEAYETADRIDTLLDNELHFAFDNTLGFLTECPTNLGTGMRASLMLHLPALEASGAMDALAKSVTKLGLALRGTYGEGSGAVGSLYQLSNQITLGINEHAALENLSAIARQVIAREQEARCAIPPEVAENDAFRALGLLQNARLLSSGELCAALSALRMGIASGIISDISLETVTSLSTDLLAANLITRHPEAEDEHKRDVLRAEAVRKALASQK